MPPVLLSNSAPPFSGRFQLIHQQTGKPVAWSSGGWIAIDTTDAGGMTSWAIHDASEALRIDLVQGDEQ